MDDLASLIEYFGWALVLLAFPIYVCFRKGKPIFGWLGIAALFPPFAPFLGWFPIVGALRKANPNSTWAREHPSPSQPTDRTGPPQPDRARAEPDQPDHRKIIDFLMEARSRGLIDQVTHQKLLGLLLRQPISAEQKAGAAEEHATVAPASPVQPVAPVVAAAPLVTVAPLVTTAPLEPGAPPISFPIPTVSSTTPPAPTSTPPPIPASVTPTPIPRPDPWAPWKDRFRKIGGAVASELALHGFVYLGVLLTFVGVFGFLFFSFQDVPDNAQPLVELAIPVIFFVWAWALRRRQAALIGKAMELLGGTVLPLVVFAGLVDNAPFPPDARGVPLIASMVLITVLGALGYSWWSSRRPDSALAYLVAPMIWLGGLVLGFAFKTDEPLQGVAITRFVSFQPALAGAVVAMTLILVSRRTDHRLSRPSLLAAVPGSAVAYVLTIALSVNEGWARYEPLLLAGASTFLAVELLARRFNRLGVLSTLRPILLAATIAPLIPIWGLAWTGLAIVVGFVALLEWDLRTSPGNSRTVMIAGAGAAVGLAMSALEPWPAVAAWAVASIWSQTRRIVGVSLPQSENALTAIAFFSPFVLGSSLLRALPNDVAWTTMGVLVAITAALVRRSDDRFWPDWLGTSASAIALGATATWFIARDENSAGLLVGAIGLAAAALGASRIAPALRVWLTSATLALGLAVGLDAARIDSEPLVWGAVGLLAVVGSALWRREPAAHLGLVGHLIGLGSLIASGFTSSESGALALWTLGWLATVIAGERGGSTVVELLARSGNLFDGPIGDQIAGIGRSTPALVLVVSAPFAVLQTAALSDTFARNRAWSGVALGLLAIVYAAFARRLPDHKPLSAILASGAAVLAVIGVAVAAPDPWSSIVTAAGSIAVAALLAGELKRPVFTWFAWLMSGVLLVLLSNRAGIPVRSLDLIALGWGGLLLIGGLAFDDLRAGRRRRGEGLRIAWLRHPVVLGAITIPLALGPSFSHGGSALGWWALATAAGYFVVAYLLRSGAVSAPAYALLAVAATVLLPESPMDRPVLFVALAATLTLCSLLAARRDTKSEPLSTWQRWDLPPLVAAHLIALLGLARASQIATLSWTAVGFGLLSVGVALWRRRQIWADAGNVLILVGAYDFGPQWLALALLATSVRGVVTARLRSGSARLSDQLMAAGAAGWSFLQLAVWQDWTATEAVSIAALVFGGLGAGVGALARFTRLPRDWAMTWGGLALVGTVLAALGTPGRIDDLGPATGMGLFALGLALAAKPLRLRGAEGMTTFLVGVAWIELLAGTDWNVSRAAAITSLVGGVIAVLCAISTRLGHTHIGPMHIDLERFQLSRLWAASLGSLALLATFIAPLFSLFSSVNSERAGPAPAIGLGLMAVASAVAARPLATPLLHYLSIVSVGWGWLVLALGLRWSLEAFAMLTAATFGIASVVIAEVARAARQPEAGDQALEKSSDTFLAKTWLSIAASAVLFAALAATASEEVRPLWPMIALGMGLLTLATVRAANPLRWPRLREASGPIAIAAVTALAHGLEATPFGMAIGVLSLGVAATLVLLVFGQSDRLRLWLRPLIVTGVVAHIEVLILALGLWPQQELLVTVLLAAGIQAVALGIVLEKPSILALGPVLIMAAWLGIAVESFSGSAQWYTAPLAATLLAEVEIARRNRRRNPDGPAFEQLILLEWAGIGLLSLPPLAEMFTGGIGFGLLAFGYAAALMVWALLTRVRRRLLSAAVLATVAAALTISAAAAGEAPPSAFFWIIAAGTGLAIILAIGIVESYRSKSGAIMHRLDSLMEGWE